MAAILTSLRNTVIAGCVLAAILLIMYFVWDGQAGRLFWAFIFRWLHVVSGVMWIGLLWYFNFVQIPKMPSIPDDQKPAISKVIAPEALFWFRWGAMATIVTGLILAHLNGYLGDALTLGAMNDFMVHKSTAIGIGMWLGIIMWFNVWFVIWPNQKIALGLVDTPAESKPPAARTAMLFSRTNTLLSIPMLFAMVSAQNIY
ncbi:putative membrane protein [Parvibaculum indicum]|uniref:urate hydroxylase PuuD n=1 Tax=Parvibaculum indicum TaxID=562969 RepID=UPI00142025BC|nr:urate hydroxylase PuuD [Parvibaculum indicum]NIJ39825.1 putative membrane protein [Parvibaculum indicum]